MKTQRIYRLDPATLETLDEITVVLRDKLRMSPSDTRPSTITKRALECYAHHLKSLLNQEDETTEDGFQITSELRRRCEAAAVLRHLNDNPTKAEKQAQVERAKADLQRMLKP